MTACRAGSCCGCLRVQPSGPSNQSVPPATEGQSSRGPRPGWRGPSTRLARSQQARESVSSKWLSAVDDSSSAAETSRRKSTSCWAPGGTRGAMSAGQTKGGCWPCPFPGIREMEGFGRWPRDSSARTIRTSAAGSTTNACFATTPIRRSPPTLMPRTQSILIRYPKGSTARGVMGMLRGTSANLGWGLSSIRERRFRPGNWRCAFSVIWSQRRTLCRTLCGGRAGLSFPIVRRNRWRTMRCTSTTHRAGASTTSSNSSAHRTG